MGATGAFGMAEAVTDGSVSLSAALHWHLRSNHYPPHPLSMIPVAVAAVEAMNAGDYDSSNCRETCRSATVARRSRRRPSPTRCVSMRSSTTAATSTGTVSDE